MPIPGYYEVVIAASDGQNTTQQAIKVKIMADTAYQTITQNLGILADNVGDLYEQQSATQEQLDALEVQVNAIDLTSVISDAAPDTATNVTRSAKYIADLFAQAKTDILGGVAEGYNTLAKVANALTALASRVTQLELDVADLKNKFDANGDLKLEFIPDKIREGMNFAGFINPVIDAIPVASDANDGWIWKVTGEEGDATENTVVLNAGTANERTVTLVAGNTLISDGVQIVKVSNKDLITSINGKTGVVVLTAADVQYEAVNGSGLASGTIKATLDTIWSTLKAKIDEIGEIAQLMTPAQLKQRIADAASDGVTTAV